MKNMENNLIEDIKKCVSDCGVLYTEFMNLPPNSAKNKFLKVRYGALLQEIIALANILEKYFSIAPETYLDEQTMLIINAQKMLGFNGISVVDGKVEFSKELEEFLKKADNGH